MLMIFLAGLGFLLGIELLVRLFCPRTRLRREPQVQIVLDKYIGYRNRPNQEAFTVDAPARINSLGFRGADIELERQPGSLRILGLGNSLTFGSGLADHQTYLFHLNEKLNARFPGRRCEVLNAAMPGFTLRQYIPFLEFMLPKVQPDIVLLGAHWRDLHYYPRFGQLKDSVNEETWQMIKKKFRERVAKCDPPETTKELFLRKLKNFIRRWRTAFVTIYLFQLAKHKLSPPHFNQWQKAFLSGEETEPIRQRRIEARKTLQQMKEMCERRAMRFALLIFPDFKQLNKVFPKSSWPSLLIETCDE
ncbi:hypothetical protein D6833_03555, partial [Candidatus Parcubacteria bacterium]